MKWTSRCYNKTVKVTKQWKKEKMTSTTPFPSTCMPGVTVTATDIRGYNISEGNDDNSVVLGLSLLDEDRLGIEKEA
eukprot:9593997-Ditylum_brightwellii.AAC.1